MGKHAKVKESDQLTVFISYSRRNSDIAEEIVRGIENRGFKALIDKRDLPYGEKWQNVLSDFITSSDTVIWLISPDSIRSKWCNWEIDEVHRQNKRLVPVRISQVENSELPRQLGKIHILPVDGVFGVNEHIDTLSEVLSSDRVWLRESTRLLDRARQWQLKDHGDGLLLRGRALSDAEAWQNQRPANAPTANSDVMELILESRKGAQKRLTKLIGSLAFGLIFALLLAAYAYWQSQIAAEESRRVIRTTGLTGWYSFENPPEQCLAMREYTGEEGWRALYCHVREVFSLSKLEALAGMPMFVQGPHKDGKLSLSEHSFGYYNPRMIEWVKVNLIPSVDDLEYRNRTQSLYNDYLANMARAYHRTYVQLSNNAGVFLRERGFLLEMLAGERDWSYMGGRVQKGDEIGFDIKAEGLNWYHVDTAVRYWQRRSIDGTARQVFSVIEAVMEVYDVEYLASAPQATAGLPILDEMTSDQISRDLKEIPEPSGPEKNFQDKIFLN